MKTILKFILSLITGFIFITILSVPVHELTHKFDYRNIEKTNEHICLYFNCSSENVSRVGYYEFEYTYSDKDTREKVKEISSYTEKHAYFVMEMFIIICCIILLTKIGGKYI